MRDEKRVSKHRRNPAAVLAEAAALLAKEHTEMNYQRVLYAFMECYAKSIPLICPYTEKDETSFYPGMTSGSDGLHYFTLFTSQEEALKSSSILMMEMAPAHLIHTVYQYREESDLGGIIINYHDHGACFLRKQECIAIEESFCELFAHVSRIESRFIQ